MLVTKVCFLSADISHWTVSAETSDYTRRQVVLTFSDDNPTRSVSIPIRDDSDIEDVETFLARLEVDSAAFPAVTVDPSITTVSIISNDSECVCVGGEGRWKK